MCCLLLGELSHHPPAGLQSGQPLPSSTLKKLKIKKPQKIPWKSRSCRTQKMLLSSGRCEALFQPKLLCDFMTGATD